MALCIFFPYTEYIENNFFCAQLLLHFSTDFDQTFLEALLSSAWHILSGFCDWIIFDRIMALCIFFPYTEYIVNNFYSAQLLLHFSMDFDQTFTEALSSSALALTKFPCFFQDIIQVFF
jgi:hypothetical protein